MYKRNLLNEWVEIKEDYSYYYPEGFRDTTAWYEYYTASDVLDAIAQHFENSSRGNIVERTGYSVIVNDYVEYGVIQDSKAIIKLNVRLCDVPKTYHIYQEYYATDFSSFAEAVDYLTDNERVEELEAELEKEYARKNGKPMYESKKLKESVSLNKLQTQEYKLNSNITLTSFRNNKSSISELADDIQKASDGNCVFPKNMKSVKLTPGCIIKINSIDNRTVIAQVGDDSNLSFYFDIYNDLKKLDQLDAEPKVAKERAEVEYAIFGCPDIYGRNSTQWHWSQRDADETEKEFKSTIAYSAKRLAEREYREYDPNSIKKYFFADKDKFIKKCNELGFNPKMD